jgi:hypothetical protein
MHTNLRSNISIVEVFLATDFCGNAREAGAILEEPLWTKENPETTGSRQRIATEVFIVELIE